MCFSGPHHPTTVAWGTVVFPNRENAGGSFQICWDFFFFFLMTACREAMLQNHPNAPGKAKWREKKQMLCGESLLFPSKIKVTRCESEQQSSSWNSLHGAGIRC